MFIRSQHQKEDVCGRVEHGPGQGQPGGNSCSGRGGRTDGLVAVLKGTAGKNGRRMPVRTHAQHQQVENGRAASEKSIKGFSDDG